MLGVECIHHWNIEAPNGNGGWSTGKCIKCKVQKKFNNVIETKSGAWAIQKPKERG